MGLNCKRDQLAWIVIPRTPANLALGLDQLQGNVVKTVCLHPDVPANRAVWIVNPPQSVRIQRAATFMNGCLRAGEVMNCTGIPDEYLRPFDDIPPEDLQDLELEREAVS